MTDSWTDSNGDTLPSDWTPGAPLTPAGEWAGACGCAPPDGPAIADSVVIKGAPGSVTSVQNGKSLWSLVLNDGTPAADFRIDRFDDTGALADSPMTIVRATGVVSFNDPVMLAEDPVEPLEAATKRYVDENAAGIPDAPDNQTYGRTLGAWNLVVPASGGTFTGQTNLAAGGAVTGGALLFAGNAVCSLPTVAQLQIGGGSLGQVPATDGAGNLSWVTPVTGGPYLPTAGGTVTGSLTVNQVLTVQGSNSLVLNAPVTGGNQRSIMGMASNVVRWVLTLGDQTAEGVGNAGSNFGLAAYSTTGAFLGNWLTIARADGSTTFNGSGVTIQGGLAVNGLLALASPNNLAIYGGSAGQVLSTNGSGVLSWATPASGGGGISDAPNDGTAYARKSAAWAHLTHTDITDWTATLAPYALTTAVPSASTTTPLMDGTAAIGTGTTWARADHVHPTDTSRYAASNPSGYQTAAQVTAAIPVASTATPLINGTAAAGSSAAWSRGDHVHPVDTSRAAASALASYLPLSGGTLTGTLNGAAATFNGGAANGFTALPYIQIQAIAGSLNPGLYLNATNGTNLASLVVNTTGSALTGAYGSAYWQIDVNGMFTVSGATAYKPGGGSWTAPSDDRIKTVVGDYAKGLDEVLALRPVEFVYKGNDTPRSDVNALIMGGEATPMASAAPYPASPHYQVAVDQTPFVGFIAQELETIFPSMVSSRPAYIDGEPVADLRDVDVSNLVYALVNAVKTLAARVDQLESGNG